MTDPAAGSPLPGYPVPPATMTDLYELTMAAGYWKLGRTSDRAIFTLSFRQAPFGGGFTIAAGLASVIAFVEQFRFTPPELAHLAGLRGTDDRPLFEPAFLDFLGDLRLHVDIDAVPEGTVVFPHEPLLRVTGSLLEAQLLETALLNLVNFPTLAATKAAHVVLAAGGAPVLEFGLRRAQGPDGGLTASRAAYLGGCSATSNVLAGRLFGIPVRGTHAHSWVLSFASEQEAFDAWADVMPGNAVMLVDTYDSVEGVANAIDTGRRLRERGYRLAGIRLDSGDLAYLSTRARELLDAEGFEDTQIIASNDLDPETIESLQAQGARIDVWGVGTKLVTCYDQPALGGVYKLTAIRDGGDWRTPVKVSSDTAKITVPGELGVRRFYDADGTARADMIWDALHTVDGSRVIVDPADSHHRMTVESAWTAKEVLVPVFRDGERVYDVPPLEASRDHARHELGTLHPAILRQLRPHWYPAGLEWSLFQRREALIEAALAGEEPVRA
ncbi:MAG TPA: nicotinate phosphoribosyltransferase [Candidatus Limnocylindrales bacterium]|nr:nicotinate phosphoribosyltransferase [Candidatus Limnocylindrales bacterium]